MSSLSDTTSTTGDGEVIVSRETILEIAPGELVDSRSSSPSQRHVLRERFYIGLPEHSFLVVISDHEFDSQRD